MDSLAAPTDSSRAQQRMLDVGAWLSLAPLVYALNLLFFVPQGDDLLRWTLLPAVILGLYVRRRDGNWRIGGLKPLLVPLLVYVGVLLAAYLALGGFASTVRAFVFVCLFLYLAAPLLQPAPWLRYAVMLSGVQLAAFAAYQHHVDGIERIGGFTNPLFFAMFAFSVGSLNLFLSTTATARWSRIGFLTAMLGAFYAVALTQSRGIAIAVVVVVPLFIACVARQSARRRHAAGYMAVVAALLLTVLAVGGITERFRLGQENLQVAGESAQSSLADQKNSVGFRLMMWRFAVDRYLQHPLFGLGKQGFEDARADYVQQGAVHPAMHELFIVAHTHNQYLQELVMRGIPGLAALLFLFCSWLALSSDLAQQARWAGFALAGLVLGFAVFGLTEVTLKHPYKIYTLVFLVLTIYQMVRPSGSARAAQSTGNA